MIETNHRLYSCNTGRKKHCSTWLLVAGMAFAYGCLVKASANDWPRFRGPDGSGRIAAQTFPSKWSDEENVAWIADIPGSGWSSPVSAKGKVFVTTAVFAGQPGPKGFRGGVSSMRTYRQDGAKNRRNTRFELHCLDRKPAKRCGIAGWFRNAELHHSSIEYLRHGISGDGRQAGVCLLRAAGTVAAFDLEGERLWTREIGQFESGNGFGSGSCLPSTMARFSFSSTTTAMTFLAALDAKSGDIIWKAKRKSRTSWSTPLVWENVHGKVIVSCSAGTITGHDPETGESVWQVNRFDGSFSSSPAVNEEMIFFGNSGPGSRGPLAAVSADAKGSRTLTLGQSIDWMKWTRAGSGPGLASPVAHDGFLYVTGGNGILSCYRTTDGEMVYKERLPSAASVAASLWIAGEQLFALDEKGKTFVLATGPEFKVKRTNQIDGLFWSTPSIVGDSLLLRSADKLHCIRHVSKTLGSL